MNRHDILKPMGIALLALIGFHGCSSDEVSDAYGQFEATEIRISSQSSGELLSFTAEEGRTLKAGEQVGQVDTTQLILREQELLAQQQATRSQIANIDAQIAVQQEQLQTARNNLDRTRRMLKDQAATPQKMDDIRGTVNTLQKQVNALQTQKQSVRAEINATQARLDQLRQQLKDAQVINPIRGTVLTTFAEPFEVVQQGQPLYEIAALDTLELKVYISGAQLPSVRLGQQVEVLVDASAEENQQLSGTISWIASEAEFTPKMIQTKEERVTQVYAVKVKVPNPNGLLKIGMPGEVNFAAADESGAAGQAKNDKQ
ncbi:HlyD family secretion protein [Fodinibius sediminis]|uniref:HlyD family secretion protein n=2 Tax=Fodinibius sediminis TaxID=1214077 RepID=A0A521DZX0_9BACT|nr:HlyD family secretion protein [Fodinibius sediminis]